MRFFACDGGEIRLASDRICWVFQGGHLGACYSVSLPRRFPAGVFIYRVGMWPFLSFDGETVTCALPGCASVIHEFRMLVALEILKTDRDNGPMA